LNFRLTSDEKLSLFDAGVRAASEFLIRFDWERYKEIRYDLAQAHIHDSGP
jgi:NTE family protein